jgi:predicted nuclease of predicted toxin-antitoxin system
VLTHDLDFGDLMAASGAITPSVVIFRLRNMRPKSVNRYLRQVIERFRVELERGAIITVTEGNLRVRELPIEKD